MSGRAVILAYHAVGSCAPEEDRHNLFIDPQGFARQMAYLARARRVVRLDELSRAATTDGPPTVALTFDDAYVGVIHHAVPVLRRFNFPATIFVPTGWVGQRAGWLGTSTCDMAVMSEEQLQEVREADVVLESHGHRHIDMGTASPEQIRDDLERSIDAIARLTDRRPRYLAYPFGRSSPAARREAERLGFDAAFSIDVPGRERFRFERTQITPLDGPALYRLKTTGRYLAWRHDPTVARLYAAARPGVRRLLHQGRS